MINHHHVDGPQAVFDATAAEYVEFAGTEISAQTEAPLDIALITAFAGYVSVGPPGRVADVGCGPGRAAAFLASRGLDVVGFDVSPAMVAAARVAHPNIVFDEGQLDALPVGNGLLAGVTCWYSIIYTPPEHLGRGFRELRRALTNGGHLLLAFQAGDGDAFHRADAFATGLPLTNYRHCVADVCALVVEAGFEVHATATRAPEFAHETSPQSFVLARRV